MRAMRKILLAGAAITGLMTLVSLHASAAPFSGLAQARPAAEPGMATDVYWEWHHHHYHHRHWYHGGWRYWD
jgi:hypothetical protein